jgi:glycosyltransferase involved in cell wall biosynthesis
MLRVFKDAQIFCLPTAYPEGLPTVILEAGALRLPVIASPAGGIAEVIHDGETGLIVPAGNPVELSKALARLIHDQALREELGRNLMDLVLSEFTWGSIAQKAARIIQSHDIEQIHPAKVD